MGFLPRYVIVVIFGGALLCGVQVPNFVSQYAQRVDARLQQVEQDLAGFRAVAQRFFHGNLEALVAAHKSSTDPRFRAEAAPLQKMIATERQLKAQQAGLSGSAYEQAGWLALHADPELLGQTWHAYAPAFALNRDALVIGGALAFALCFTLEVIIVLLRGGARRIRGRRAVHE